MNDVMTVSDAKAETTDLERAVATAFPSEVVVSLEQLEQGALLPCRDDTYQWTGRVDIVLTAPQDESDVLDRVTKAFTDREGYVAERRADETWTRVVVEGPEGLAFVGSYEEDTSTVSVLSASRCVRLQEGESPSDRF